MSCRVIAGAALAALCLIQGRAEAHPLAVRRSLPAAEAIVDGRNTQYLVRFDGLVDHQASRLYVTQGGKVVLKLVVSQDSAPDVLSSSGPTLSPGRYTLHWYARSAPDGEVSEGDIPFSVRP